MRVVHRIAAISALLLAFGCGDKAGDAAGKAGDKAKAAAGKAGDKAKAAAGKAGETAKGAVEEAAGGVSLLALVPADTPYLFANTQKLPAEFSAKIGKAFTPLIAKLEKEMAAEKAKLGDSPQDKLGKALIEELEGNLSRDGLKKLGLDPDFRFAIYGVGLLPVFRMQLSDEKALRAAIARVEQKSGQKAPTAKLGPQEYWTFTEDGTIIAMAIVGDQFVLGFAPEALAPKMLPALFGQARPAATAAAEYAKISGKYGYKGMAGFIDIVRIANTVMGDAQGLDKEIFDALSAGDGPKLTPACKSEIGGIVAQFPRMVVGYTEISGAGVSAMYVFETEATLAKELKGLTAAVAGLGADDGALISFGAALDLKKTIAFVKSKAAALKAKPYTCPDLAEMNEGIQQMAMGMAQLEDPQMARFLGIRGFNVVVKDAKMGPQGPSGVKATALVAAEGADELFTMIKAMVPPLAQLNVPADGTPVALPPGLIPPIVEAPHVALTKTGIALSVGAGEEKGLKALLDQGAKPGPVAAFTYDIKRFMGMMGEQMGMGMDSEEKELVDAFTNLVGRTGYVLEFGDAGLVIRQSVTLP